MNQQAYITQLANRYGVDPAAALSIASVEGGFGGSVGDNGTSFGPFQLHIGGAMPRGISNPAQWANSPAGLDYAMQHIAGVAKGLRGQQAIAAISSRFERPANVPGEISKAAGRYGQFSGGGTPPGGGMAVTAGAPAPAVGGGGGGGNGDARKAALMSLIQSNNSFITGNAPTVDPMQTLQMLQQVSNQQPGEQGGASLKLGSGFQIKGVNPSDPADQKAVALAQHFIGTPYVWGGESKSGFDCSGLLQYVWAKNGVNIPRTTYDQFQTGQSVAPNALRPGDAVFFKGSDSRNGLPGHVGLYIGNGKFIEAPHTGSSVHISTLAGYPGYMGARRYG